jgi:hypothetical protein
MAEFEDWEEVAARRPLSDDHNAAYRQLSDAEYELDELRKRRRLSPAKLDELAEARPVRSFAALSDELVSLTKVVEALGGHVEVRAVFHDETITLLREPEPEPDPESEPEPEPAGDD